MDYNPFAPTAISDEEDDGLKSPLVPNEKTGPFVPNTAPKAPVDLFKTEATNTSPSGVLGAELNFDGLPDADPNRDLTVARDAVSTDPKLFKQNVDTANGLSVPLSVVEQDTSGNLRTQHQAQRLLNSIEKSPYTKEWFKKVENARLAHKDAEKLSMIEIGYRKGIYGLLDLSAGYMQIIDNPIKQTFNTIAHHARGFGVDYGTMERGPYQTISEGMESLLNVLGVETSSSNTQGKLTAAQALLLPEKEKKKHFGYIEGATWDEVKSDPVSNIVPFIVETGLASLPEMGVALANLPFYVAGKTGQIGSRRAENIAEYTGVRNSEATLNDFLMALPYSTAMSVLERMGAQGMLGIKGAMKELAVRNFARSSGRQAVVQGTKIVAGQAGKAFVKEAGTEAVQEPTELVGEKAFVPGQQIKAEELLDAAAAGIVVGGPMGGGIRTATASAELGYKSRQVSKQAAAIREINNVDVELRDTAPEVYADYHAGLMESQGVESVRISSEGVNILNQNMGDEAPNFSPRDEYENITAETGVSIDAKTFWSLPQEQIEAIAEHVSFDINGETAREAQESAELAAKFAEINEEELQKELDELDAEDALTVRIDEALTQAGSAVAADASTSRAAAQQMAAAFSALARRENISVDSLVEDFLPRIEKLAESDKVAPNILNQIKEAEAELAKGFKDERIPELEEAARRREAREITQEEYNAIVSDLKPIRPYTSVPTPATTEEMTGALKPGQQPKVNTGSQHIGQEVGLRLDIPAYTRFGVWVPTIHVTGGTAHEAAARITNVTFTQPGDTAEIKAGRVGRGEQNKSPFAQMRGTLESVDPAELEAMAQEVLNDPEWTQVGYDPRRHTFFYDRATQKPVLSADEVIQVGPLVLAKNAVKDEGSDFLFQEGDPKVSTEQAGAFVAKVDDTGFVTIVGDAQKIRASLPEGVRGTIVPDGVRFTPNFTTRVLAALRGDKMAFSRAGKVTKHQIKNGKYVGASPRNDTPAKIKAWRKSFKRLAKEGERGRFWYENSSAAILQLTGGNVAEAKQFSALLAIYSPQAKVAANATFALRAWAQYKAGDPIKVKTGVQDKAASELLYDGKPWGGEKTNNFYLNLLREIDPSTQGKQGATIDMWMMHAGGYSKDFANSSEYAFMENETNRLAKELGWEPQQVQAAVWVGIKARMENPQVKKDTEASSEKAGWIKFETDKKTGKKKRKVVNERKHFANWFDHGMAHTLTPEDTDQAKFDFSDGIARHTGQISWETIPSTSTTVLPGIQSATYPQLKSFQKAIQKALSSPSGEDLIAEYLGILADGSVIAPGVWEGAVSPSSQTVVAMAPAAAGVLYYSTQSPDAAPLTEAEYKALSAKQRKAYEKRPSIDPSQKKLLDLYAATLALVLRQDGVGYHKPFFGGSSKGSNGVNFDIDRPLTVKETRSLEKKFDKVMRDAGYTDWSEKVALISAPTGMRIVSIDPSFIPNVELHKLAKEAWTATGVDVNVVGYFASDGSLVSNDWKESPNGEDLRREIIAAGRPDVLDWARDVLYPEIHKVYREYSKKYRWGATGPTQFFQDGRRDGGDARRVEEALPGAPANFSGPIQELVDAAKAYAEKQGIDYSRQGEYVKINEEFAARIAQAYADMPHAPNDPKVKEAYADLARQVRNQYDALTEAGYTFTFYDGDTDPYGTNPWEALRDLRDNKKMAVYGTYDGYGTEGITDSDLTDNPMLKDTGLRWKDQTGEERVVTENDLFRAVHDAFGHGLEGAGFRAQGEENAWQAHARLFTGPALGALTSETRGQNSWLNYGPHGENNRTAGLFDTVFAEQKTGLMPEWTWSEQVAPAYPEFKSGVRGSIDFSDMSDITIRLFKSENLSTFLHESGHLYLEMLRGLAGRDGASTSLKEDYQTVLEFLGSDGKSPFTTDQHEKFAETYETYLMEGRAPANKLSSAFSKFSAWLGTLYRNIMRTGALSRADLTPEIRDVFDRLLATEEEIATAKQNARMLPAFTSAEQMQVSEEVYNAYNEQIEKAEANQKRELLVRTFSDVKRERTAWWKEERNREEQNVLKSLDDEPSWRARYLIQHGRLPSGAPAPDVVPQYLKLGTDFIADMGFDISELPGGRGLYRKTGLHPDFVAQELGFGSGSEMLAALAAMPRGIDGKFMTEKAFARQEADVRLKELHGDILTDGSMQEEALLRVHSEAQASVIARELSELNRLSGQSKAPANQIMKSAAAEMLRTKSFKELKRHDKYLNAERRYASQATQFIAEQDYKAAHEAKQKQLLNFHLYRIARQKTKQMEGRLRTLQRWNKQKDNGSIHPDFFKMAKAILTEINFRPRMGPEKQARLTSAMFESFAEEANKDFGARFTVDPHLDDALSKRHYSDFTADEIDGLYDTVKSIRVQGARYTKAQQAQFESIVSNTARSIKENQTGKNRVIEADQSRWQRLKSSVRFFNVEHRKALSIIRELDGNRHGGPLYQELYQTVKRADDAYIDRSMKAAKIMQEIFSVYSVKERAAMGIRMHIPELKDIAPSGLSLQARLAFGLNLGNAGNVDALRNEYTDEQIAAVRDTLTDKDWDVIEAVWAHIDSYWEDLSALEERTTGVKPKKVEPSPFVLPSGRKIAGGYYPLVGDPARSDSAKLDYEENQSLNGFMKGGRASKSTKHGSTIERVGFGDRKVWLDIRVAFDHIDGVSKDIELREAISYADRILKHSKISNSIREALSPEHLEMLNRWVSNTVGDSIQPQVTVEKFIQYARTGASMAEMGFSFRTIAMQLFGITGTMGEIGEVRTLKAVGEFSLNPNLSTETVLRKSSFMRNRGATFNRDIRDVERQFGVSGLKKQVVDAAFWGISKFDMAVAVPTWMAAYDKFKDENPNSSEQDAVDFADETVSRTQGSGLPREMADIQQGPQWKRMFTMFYTFFSAYHNLQVDQWKQTDFKNAGQALKWAKNQLWITIIPSILVDFIFNPRTEEDDENLWWWGAKSLAKYVFGGLVGIRDAVNMVASGFAYDVSPAGGLIDNLGAAGRELAKVFDDEKDANAAKIARTMVMAAGYAGHVPGARAVERGIRTATHEDFSRMDGIEKTYRLLVSGPPKD